jgi:hypothetical protein
MKTVIQSLTLCAIAGALAAQTDNPPVIPGKIGFAVAGVQGSAGILCSGYRCGVYPLGITRGETLALSIRTQLRSPWLLLVGIQPLVPCQAISGIGNLWAGPTLIVAAGTVTAQDNIRCWGGKQSSSIPVPKTVPLKASVVFQVVADVQISFSSPAKAPVFSAPVQVTVTR